MRIMRGPSAELVSMPAAEAEAPPVWPAATNAASPGNGLPGTPIVLDHAAVADLSNDPSAAAILKKHGYHLPQTHASPAEPPVLGPTGKRNPLEAFFPARFLKDPDPSAPGAAAVPKPEEKRGFLGKIEHGVEVGLMATEHGLGKALKFVWNHKGAFLLGGAVVAGAVFCAPALLGAVGIGLGGAALAEGAVAAGATVAEGAAVATGAAAVEGAAVATGSAVAEGAVAAEGVAAGEAASAAVSPTLEANAAGNIVKTELATASRFGRWVSPVTSRLAKIPSMAKKVVMRALPWAGMAIASAGSGLTRAGKNLADLSGTVSNTLANEHGMSPVLAGGGSGGSPGPANSNGSLDPTDPNASPAAQAAQAAASAGASAEKSAVKKVEREAEEVVQEVEHAPAQ